MTPFTVFVSSTVRDFAPVRRDLKAWLEARQIKARLSERNDFPVSSGVTSHEACVRAVDGCHAFVLLIGHRYGGCVDGSKQSITWREYEAARDLGIPIIAFVLRVVNEEAARAAKRGDGKPDADSGTDERVFGFIDAIRKGHTDNWVHLEWDGSLTELTGTLESRLNWHFAEYQGEAKKLRRLLEREASYAKVRAATDGAATLLVSQLASVAAGGNALKEKAKLVDAVLLDALVSFREELFGFRGEDRFNFAVYRREGEELRVFARRAHHLIKRRDRVWKMGEGHVGLAAKRGDVLVAKNLSQTPQWAGQPGDAENYISAVAAPIKDVRNLTGSPIGVFVVTSSRQDQFRELLQAEVSMCESIASVLAAIRCLES